MPQIRTGLQEVFISSTLLLSGITSDASQTLLNGGKCLNASSSGSHAAACALELLTTCGQRLRRNLFLHVQAAQGQAARATRPGHRTGGRYAP